MLSNEYETIVRKTDRRVGMDHDHMRSKVILYQFLVGTWRIYRVFEHRPNVEKLIHNEVLSPVLIDTFEKSHFEKPPPVNLIFSFNFQLPICAF